MRVRALFALTLAISVCVVMLLLPAGASAKTIGGCPPGFDLVTVASLGITPEEASGLPSLDGNNDGRTCIKAIPAAESSPFAGGKVFRDNTVMGGRG